MEPKYYIAYYESDKNLAQTDASVIGAYDCSFDLINAMDQIVLTVKTIRDRLLTSGDIDKLIKYPPVVTLIDFDYGDIQNSDVTDPYSDVVSYDDDASKLVGHAKSITININGMWHTYRAEKY
jgi:hypothetical protein